MLVPHRTFSSPEYRYGFQGQEKDDEIKGNGNSINFKYRIHDPRVGRFFAMDPLTPQYPHNSPYAFSENRVIDMAELEGKEIMDILSKSYDWIVGEEALKKSSTHQVISRVLNNTADRSDPARIGENLAKSTVNDPVNTALTFNMITGPFYMAKNFVNGITTDINAARGNSETTTQAEGVVDVIFDAVDVGMLFYGGARTFGKPKVKPKSIGAKAAKGKKIPLVEGSAEIATIESTVVRTTRRAAFRKAKRDAGVTISQNPIKIEKVKMTDRNGKAILNKKGEPIFTREYYFKNNKGKSIIIQEHSAGHNFGSNAKGNQGPHFNVRPADNTRTGTVEGTKSHYDYEK